MFDGRDPFEPDPEWDPQPSGWLHPAEPIAIWLAIIAVALLLFACLCIIVKA